MNNKLAYDTLEHIKARPDDHDQGHWVAFSKDNGVFLEVDEEDLHLCGTKMCFAGHAAVLAGADQPLPRICPFSNSWSWEPWRLDDKGTIAPRDGRGLSVADFAAKKLGLTERQAEYLFLNTTTIEDIERTLDYIRDHSDCTYNDLITNVGSY